MLTCLAAKNLAPLLFQTSLTPPIKALKRVRGSETGNAQGNKGQKVQISVWMREARKKDSAII